MFKNAPLPENCPPNTAHQAQKELRLFRILHSDVLNTDSFLTYQQLYPENKRYRNLCVAFAVSMFTSVEYAVAAYRASVERNKVLGTHMAELILQPSDGVFEVNPNTGHCSFWFYESCTFAEISCVQIIQIDENT